MSERPHPFDLVFGPFVAEKFPAIRTAVGDRPSLDAFLMVEPVISFLQELRPDEGLGDRDDFVALVHAAFRFWVDGCHTHSFDEPQTRALLAPSKASTHPLAAQYIQISPRLVWSSLDGGEHHEPLDGWFVVPIPEGIRVVAAFGLHAGRPGLSILMAEGRVSSGNAAREDGTPFFAPMLMGGDVAGLHEIISLEELLHMAWNAVGIAEDG